uniref:Uncharacterized protein n=1 Tax=Mus musculus TaxID=10090 RepID=Q3UTG6_MOUSE|nr:unnamed protein product [Mus musculus]
MVTVCYLTNKVPCEPRSLRWLVSPLVPFYVLFPLLSIKLLLVCLFPVQPGFLLINSLLCSPSC